MKYKINNFSVYDNYTIEECGSNVSYIVDKLIRLTAKQTEDFAGDIVYLINAFVDAVENNRRYEKLIQFRESGVNWYDCCEHGDYVDRGEGNHMMQGGQCWYLLNEASDEWQERYCILKRVTLQSVEIFPKYLGGST